LQADGGTRTASITGAWIALHDAFAWAVGDGIIPASPLLDHCAAISVGVVGSEILLDLPYEEDVAAEVDFNVVMTGAGRLIEVQGTAEREPYTRDQLDRMLDVAAGGIAQLVKLQAESIAE
jgi:ribonuclease PH